MTVSSFSKRSPPLTNGPTDSLLARHLEEENGDVIDGEAVELPG